MSDQSGANFKASNSIPPNTAPRVPRVRWPFMQAPAEPAQDLAPMAAELAAAPDIPLPAPGCLWRAPL